MNDNVSNPYERDLGQVGANHVPLTPLSWLSRAASVYPERAAVVHGERRFTWAETFARCRRLASALAKRGIGKGDTVAMIATNIPAFYEGLFGIPAVGAVINPINIRLDADAIAFILDHGEAKVVITDTEFAPTVRDALSKCEAKPLVREAIGSSSVSSGCVSSSSPTSSLSSNDSVAGLAGAACCMGGGAAGAAGAGGGFGGGGAAEPRESIPSATPGIRERGTQSETPSNQTISLNLRFPAFR